MSISSITSAINGFASTLNSAVGAPTPPPSQKVGSAPISFIFIDGSIPAPNTWTLNLVIRPEELTRTDPSRMTVQQTLGGAWADDFGPGLGSINISGTTGWRMNEITQANQKI